MLYLLAFSRTLRVCLSNMFIALMRINYEQIFYEILNLI